MHALALRHILSPFLKIKIAEQPSVFILGRSSACEIVVAAPSVSRRHAEIRHDKCKLSIRDLGSRNGTFVSEKSGSSFEVQIGQLVRFGHVSFVLTDDNMVGSDAEEETDSPGQQCAGLDELRITEFSEAQQRVLDLVLTGLPEKDIARRIGLSRHTVPHHVRKLMRLLAVHSRTEVDCQIAPRQKSESSESLSSGLVMEFASEGKKTAALAI